MSGPATLTRIEDIIDASGVTPRVEALLPIGVRHRQLKVRTLLAGMMLTLDALHTTKKTARLITGPLNAHYTLILKGNQPLALQTAQRLLSGTDTEGATLRVYLERYEPDPARRSTYPASCRSLTARATVIRDAPNFC